MSLKKFRTLFLLACLAVFSGTAKGVSAPTAVDGSHQRWTRHFEGVPAIAVSRTNGRLWATWYASPSDNEDINNYIVLATSDDGGASWREVAQVDEDGTGSFRQLDPQIWIGDDGMLNWSWSLRWGGESELSAYGTEKLMRVKLNAESLPTSSPPQPVEVGNGVMVCKPACLASGKWIYPIAHWHQAPSVYVATDGENGAFTTIGSITVPSTSRGNDEPIIVEKSTGDLVAFIRGNSSGWKLMSSESTDSGKNWTAPVNRSSDIGSPVSRLAVRRLANGHWLMVKHGNMGETTSTRTRLKAFVSEDDGATWKGGLLLDARANVSYPDIDEDASGNIYVIYDHERSGEKGIYFARFTEADAAQGSNASGTAIFRRSVHVRADRTLPVEFKRGTYVEARAVQSGAGYDIPVVDTLVKGASTVNFALNIELLGDALTSSDNVYLLGEKASGTAADKLAIFANVAQGACGYLNFGTHDQKFTTSVFDDHSPTVISNNNAKVFVDGNQVLGLADQSFASSLAITLFACRTSANSYDIRPFGARVYGLKLTDEGVLVRDLVPALRQQDGTVGFFDLVNGDFHADIRNSKSLLATDVVSDYAFCEAAVCTSPSKVDPAAGVQFKTIRYLRDEPPVFKPGAGKRCVTRADGRRYFCTGAALYSVGNDGHWSFVRFIPGTSFAYDPANDPPKFVLEWQYVEKVKVGKGYRQTAYLEGDGSAYVDTLFTVSTDHAVEMTSQLVKEPGTSSGNWCNWFGSRTAYNSRAVFANYNMSYEVNIAFANEGSLVSQSNFCLDNKETKIIPDKRSLVGLFTTIRVSATNLQYECEHTRYSRDRASSPAAFSTPGSCFVFAARNCLPANSSTAKLAPLRVTEFTIYNADGTLALNFVPCRSDDDTQHGFWETVEGKFYGPAGGTGSFACGPDLQLPFVGVFVR